MTMIHHLNVVDPEGQIYCCLRNRVVPLNEYHKAKFCSGCKMFNSDLQGQGVECVWDDQRMVENPHVVLNPHKEWKSNQTRKINPEIQVLYKIFSEGSISCDGGV
jgi:hypothetical protein